MSSAGADLLPLAVPSVAYKLFSAYTSTMRGVWKKGRPDLSGQRFGKLEVIRLLGERHNGHRQFLCQCDCGKQTKVTANNLRSKNTESCGCLYATLGGLYNSPLHKVWRGMMRRCYEKQLLAYKGYGARGIQVCDAWHNFQNFYADMNPTHKKGLSLERIDNAKGYSPENCKWATALEQGRNKRNVILYDFEGEKLPLKEIARRTGIPSPTLYWRRKHGKEFLPKKSP